MKIAQPTISLDNFEGSVDLLWHLIQTSELDIYDVPIHRILTQYLASVHELELDAGAEFIGIVASLIWLKSKLLLPKHEQPIAEPEELDPDFEKKQLEEYCRFKEIAKVLTVREEKQQNHFVRGWKGSEEHAAKKLGIEHVSLEELASLFQQVIAKAAASKGQIQEEIWRVSDKIAWMRKAIKEQNSLAFFTLFSSDLSREELIVTFLALLELMKMGEMRVVRNSTTLEITIISQ